MPILCQFYADNDNFDTKVTITIKNKKGWNFISGFCFPGSSENTSLDTLALVAGTQLISVSLHLRVTLLGEPWGAEVLPWSMLVIVTDKSFKL